MTAKVSATKVCPGCSARYPPDALFCPNDGSPLTATPLAQRDSDAGLVGDADGHDSYLGREISGHIEIRKLAGVGAMGRVYRAFQKGIDRDVAVKVLHRELSANQQLVARFHREAKVASRLQHPNVVGVHLAGQLPDGAMYIVMEYLDGLSLQSALAAAGGPLPIERALHIVLQICDAAGEAHSHGVVHRDIKPENVMLVRRGDDPDFVKVLDFGIARLNWGEQSMATAAGLIFGTARYISPEGAQGEAVGPAGDVYAIATLLYQMLAGRTPFEGDQAVGLLVAQIHDPPPPIRSIAATALLPDALATVIMRNLSKTPGDRAPDGRTLGRALVEAAKSVGLSAEELVPRSSLFVPAPRLSDPSALVPQRASDPGPPPTLDSARVVATERDPVLPDAGALAAPPGVKTQKWSPPAGASTSPAPPPSFPAVPVASPSLADGASAREGFPPPARPYASSVDATLDDSASIPLPPVAAEGARRLARTEPGIPLAAVAPVASPAPGPAGPAAASPAPVPPPAHVPAVAVAQGAPSVDARARVDPSLYDEQPRRRGRVVGVVLVCFLVGMVAAFFGMYQFGIIGTGVRPGSLDEAVAHAEDALRRSRWDTPPGDNVRDLTNDALAKWPRNARILDVRARATDELVKEAVGQKFAGDLAGALHWARLANELDPTDTTAQHLVEEYERAAKTQGIDAATSAAKPPSTPPSRGSSRPVPSSATLKVTVEASLSRPRVGQPVSFVARMAGGTPRSIEEPRFVINGPGLAPDTKLGTIPESGGTYQATFTGFEPGRYDVTFDAKADGAPVRATRTIVIEGGAVPPPSSAPSLPSSVPSGKWL